MSTSLDLAAFCFGALLLLSPAIANRAPFIFYDTAHYLEFGRSIVSRLPVIKRLAITPDETATASVNAEAKPADNERDHPSLAYAGGRSPYYSFGLFVLTSLGGLWTVTIAQALCAATLLWMTAKTVEPLRPATLYVTLAAVLAALSSLPFYVAMPMPDLFAGLALLGAGILAFSGRRLTSTERGVILAITSFSAMTHATIPVVLGSVAIVMTMGASALRLAGWKRIRRPLGLALIPVAAAVLGSLAFNLASRALLGEAPRSPPYLMARILADEPGRAYLHRVCENPGAFAVCAYQDRAFKTQDDFLWSGDSRIGVFSIIDPASRRRLQDEEIRFFLVSVADDPLDEAWLAFRRTLEQIARFGIDPDFSIVATSWSEMKLAKLLPNDASAVEGSLAFRGEFPFAAFDLAQYAAVLASLLFLALRLSRGDVRAALRDRQAETTALVLAAAALGSAILINAALCGVFSGVNDRYEARLIWPLPLLGLVVARRLGAQNCRPKAP